MGCLCNLNTRPELSFSNLINGNRFGENKGLDICSDPQRLSCICKRAVLSEQQCALVCKSRWLQDRFLLGLAETFIGIESIHLNSQTLGHLTNLLVDFNWYGWITAEAVLAKRKQYSTIAFAFKTKYEWMWNYKSGRTASRRSDNVKVRILTDVIYAYSLIR